MSARPLFWTAAAALSLLVACGPEVREHAPTPAPRKNAESATVQVENQGLSEVAVYEEGDPTRIGTVMPGRSRCLRMQVAVDQKRLIARPVGGGQATVSPVFQTNPGEGWKWRVGTNPSLDGISLTRAEPCAKGTERSAGG